ncbi:Gfo/Idh/MocA family protein [Humibacter albus]|uniref:Gfo/Idh/MocA family protein n=1 Tax=Humibacter albus TaxID=427754 RepID=UPI0003B45A6A|nr:Gfo/Idh/MocA family oxidoreductase [Humibacter albus]
MGQDFDRLGVGLISVGWMGKVHARAYRALPEFYPELGIRPVLVHAADTAADRLDYARDGLGFARASTDYHAVIDDPEVDVVSICAPNFLHAEMATAAASAGKAFWIEKPAGRDASETQAIAEAADAAHVVTAVGFNYRNAPAVEHAKKLIADGAIGRITNVRGTMFADYSAEPAGGLSWRFIRSLAGSGVLGDLMGHLVDLVQYLVGPIDDVAALTSTVHATRPKLAMGQATHFAVSDSAERGEVENEDYAGMLVRLSDGAVGTLEASRVATGRRAHYELEVYGTEGALVWDFERMNELRLAVGRGPHSGFTSILAGPGFGDFARFQPGAGTGMGYDDLKVIEASKFLASYSGREAPSADIHDALAAARVAAAAEAAASDRTWHAVPPTAGTNGAGTNGAGANGSASQAGTTT